MTYRARSAFLLSSFSLSVLVATAGCGGNVVVDHGGDSSGPGGAGGSGGTTGPGAGGSQSTSSSSQPPSQYGTPTVACVEKAGKLIICAQGFGDDPTQKLEKSCHESKSQIVDHCSAEGTLGCCGLTVPKFGFVEECVYGDGITAKQFEQTCVAQKGKFTTSP